MKLKINKNFTKWSIKKLEIKKLRTNLKKKIYYKLGLKEKIQNK
jgi:hypothetical protein